MNGSHVLAFVIGAGAILACQLFAALLLGKRTPTPEPETAELTKLKCSHRIAVDFILWLTPCGQCKPAPSIETIGKEARSVYNKMVLLESPWRAPR